MAGPVMPSMGFVKHVVAYITLGLLCGWYQFVFVLLPILLYGSWRGSYICIGLITTLIAMTVSPLKFKAWPWFINECGIWKLWLEYFNFQHDWSSLTAHFEAQKKAGKTLKECRYIFFEMPHGVFPMGSFMTACLIKDILPGIFISTIVADVLFSFPGMRHIMAWIGAMPASRKNISKIFARGDSLALLPGGIAEIFLVSEEEEAIYLRKRRSTVRAAIQEGAAIVPTFFFGNSKLFTIVGKGSDSFLSKLSRKLRTSIVLFYGRNYLPVPLRHQMCMVTGDIVDVKQSEQPTDAEIDEVMERVVKSVTEMYEKKKPEWEKRPLVIH
ncbi:diacylglycerol acyltransferase-domain-containing protein [Ochromonadaceae sp. CCMP2298]|nr:diacylglycerol acyltransferase-domain-containing protein [Ochromonadaceae sp. CCMP2298]|mmetsp:Transcript_12557/g.27881  ORF Transcript_12557/g.27881 Transcript_12557/m.27881 type:complete len:327 (+) Transcript_12557:95-1075(+)|eukprot:CAMPEP_0173342960 /NCGR_PEP_ID=MMETSP1144-20121109/10518_1 /TAXON_ID=483371 /ORGANISM="non described non described, Strain CCMP2298" /LENGTH=326 /DNA_ID=CAMNT_0014289653 /DNA_START=53 /DNA_END=1033 /DNA_ORIENTATION=-